jgi:carbonic anhydrase
VRAALAAERHGLIDNWLRHVQDIRERYADLVDTIADHDTRVNRLCELNVIEQVLHVCETTIVQDAWAREQSLSVHGWIYGLDDGRLHDLEFSASSVSARGPAHAAALRAVAER